VRSQENFFGDGSRRSFPPMQSEKISDEVEQERCRCQPANSQKNSPTSLSKTIVCSVIGERRFHLETQREGYRTRRIRYETHNLHKFLRLKAYASKLEKLCRSILFFPLDFLRKFRLCHRLLDSQLNSVYTGP
jgi:hypothetical protein